jgi:SAM-dependent methyltransferase
MFGPKSIDYYIARFVKSSARRLKGKVVVDIPAGKGATSALLHDAGACVEPFDLFPSRFVAPGLSCSHADLNEQLPVEDAHADWIICQEGIEHVANQLNALREFNRILKKKGTLLLTTPNHSKLKSKLSYLLFETETLNKAMPPNELESVWMKENGNGLYLGHLFLVGIQKLRVLGRLAGFRIVKLHQTRANRTSLALFPSLYPFIVISSLLSYTNALRKSPQNGRDSRKKLYWELVKLNVNPTVLLDGYLFVEFQKDLEYSEIARVIPARDSHATTTL